MRKRSHHWHRLRKWQKTGTFLRASYWFSLSAMTSSPTVCVTCGWAGRGNATLPEPTPSHANCLKTRRLPPVGCTLCWAIHETQDLSLEKGITTCWIDL